MTAMKDVSWEISSKDNGDEGRGGQNGANQLHQNRT